MSYCQKITLGLTLITLFSCASIASGESAYAQLRPMIYSETTVEVAPDTAFADWTSKSGVEAFFAPQATIEAKPGGLYELCFEPASVDKGQCGNDDGRILALQEGRMLSFTWAMPPYMPEIRPHLTVVQILFEPVGDKQTHVRLFHTGFGSGDAWDQGRAYFEAAWPQVLENYRMSTLSDQP